MAFNVGPSINQWVSFGFTNGGTFLVEKCVHYPDESKIKNEILNNRQRKNMHRLSVIIITHNEEKNIEACIRSVSRADEIVVVDDFSTDRTREIAAAMGVVVFTNAWTNFSDQKAFALSKASHNWVLSLDADERVSPELMAEIQSLLQGTPACDGYTISRKSFYLGRWIRHCGWSPGYQLRLFQKAKTHLTPVKVHEGFVVEGTVCRLQNQILHYTVRSLDDHFKKLFLYSTLEAEEKAGHKTAHWYDIFLHPLSTFLRNYISLSGFKDGKEGFLLSVMTALGNAMLYLKLFEIQRIKRPIP
ncbi:putative glycosyl transferase [bacterium BMS3Abin05]|nr:putative glycosyl transferase [bacterium BMS3Abin05]HDK36357.1 glycosyltransferase family 2 protein [Bacteroidota bacterium]HDZ12116.1 glycosyltransferase family 2 protein [Bacteroidota bacterium]